MPTSTSRSSTTSRCRRRRSGRRNYSGALSRTRILLPVCSPRYFQDEWCLAEWHSMAKREEILGMSSQEKPEGLIYPVIFSDSRNFPQYARDRKMRNCRDWNQPYPQFQASQAYLGSTTRLDRIAEELVDIIEQAPPWRPDWPVTMPKPEPRPRVSRFRGSDADAGHRGHLLLLQGRCGPQFRAGQHRCPAGPLGIPGAVRRLGPGSAWPAPLFPAHAWGFGRTRGGGPCRGLPRGHGPPGRIPHPAHRRRPDRADPGRSAGPRLRRKGAGHRLGTALRGRLRRVPRRMPRAVDERLRLRAARQPHRRFGHRRASAPRTCPTGWSWCSPRTAERARRGRHRPARQPGPRQAALRPAAADRVAGAVPLRHPRRVRAVGELAAGDRPGIQGPLCQLAGQHRCRSS